MTETFGSSGTISDLTYADHLLQDLTEGFAQQCIYKMTVTNNVIDIMPHIMYAVT